MNIRRASSKNFLTIGDLAKEFGVTHRALRYYEKYGLLSPRRNGNARLYSSSDRARLKLVLLGKRIGLSLVDIGELLELYDIGGMDENVLSAALGKCTTQLRVMKKEREIVEETIFSLERAIAILRHKLGGDMLNFGPDGWVTEANETARGSEGD
jgi:DNA-binding transcriptional MerR regulator